MSSVRWAASRDPSPAASVWIALTCKAYAFVDEPDEPVESWPSCYGSS